MDRTVNIVIVGVGIVAGSLFPSLLGAGLFSSLTFYGAIFGGGAAIYLIYRMHQ